jgi:hypothetical protein
MNYKILHDFSYSDEENLSEGPCVRKQIANDGWCILNNSLEGI